MTNYEVVAPQLFTKRSEENLKFVMDFTAWLEDDELTISTVSVSNHYIGGDVGNLTITNTTINGMEIELYVAGGTHGRSYHIDITITTSDSSTLIGKGMLRVLDE